LAELEQAETEQILYESVTMRSEKTRLRKRLYARLWSAQQV